MPESVEIVAKFVAYLAVILSLGCVGASWLTSRRAVPVRADLEASLAVRLAMAAAVLVAATLVRAWAHTASAFGVAEAWVWENLRLIAFESRWGEGWRLQALSALALAAAAVVTRNVRDRSARQASFVPAVWTLAALGSACAVPQTGHAAAEPFRWLLHGAHVVAAGLWAGTLLIVVTLRGNDRRMVPHLLRAFDTLATPAVALVAASGLWASALYVGGWANLLSTEYGRLLLAKGSVVAVMALLGAVNWLRLRRDSVAELPVTVYLEAVLAVGVVVLTAWLTETAHP